MKKKLTKSIELFNRSKKVIPGCAQTFSKGYTQYVQGIAPIFLDRGKGSYVWDVDGNKYLDFVQGLLPNILGYADEAVNTAVTEQIAQGHSFSMPHPLEVELAEKLVSIIPSAEMVRFGRNGSDATTAAVRCARAYTGRDVIACCGYHGWQDWYIGSTSRSKGVPEAVRQLTKPFTYNNIDSLKTIFEQNSENVACVIMEPKNFIEPKEGFLEEVQELCRKNGSLLIFDEICIGWHIGLGGAQKKLGITPDMSTFGKAMGNGFPISVVVGKAEIMRLFEEIFVSFTFAGEVSAMAASMEVIRRLETEPITQVMGERGEQLIGEIKKIATSTGLENQIVPMGIPQWSIVKFYDLEGKESLSLKSLFQQEFLKRGILTLGTHNLNATFSSEDLAYTINAYREVLPILSGALKDNVVEQLLEGEKIQAIFKVR